MPSRTAGDAPGIPDANWYPPRASCTLAGRGKRECRSPVSRILSPSCEAGRPFLSLRRSGAPCLRRMRLIPGNERAGSPFPVLSCTTRGLPCRPVTRIRGGLLLHHFTLACALAGHRRYLSAALIRPGFSRYPSLAFARRVALWCPDFPHLPLARKLRPSRERRAETGPRWRIVQLKTPGTPSPSLARFIPSRAELGLSAPSS